MERSETAVAIFIPAKGLRLQGQFTQRELLQSINQFVNDQLPPNNGVGLDTLLEQQIELLFALDGLDELRADLAGRILRQAATLPDHWPTIQIVATARPIEVTGVAYADWLVVHTVPLDDEGKIEFIAEELKADGIEASQADYHATSLLRSLKQTPMLDSLATSPLAIRLLYGRLRDSSSNRSLTLGDLLYELLLERLGGWQKRDDKPSAFGHFDAILPTPEAKAEFFAVLAKKAAVGSRITMDEAKASLEDAATLVVGANKHLLAEEALNCFAWLGMIEKDETIEFPLLPLIEVSAALDLLKQWRDDPASIRLPDQKQWRLVSFAAAIARRRGWLAELRDPILQFIDSILHNPSNVPAACYIVAESSDATCAERTVRGFQQLGYRPLKVFGDEQRTSAHNIAKTLWLAGNTGFEWLFGEYLDPRYPLTSGEGWALRYVFEEWAALARGHLEHDQEERITRLVKPYVATGEAQFYGVLSTLSLLVPEAFEFENRLWYQALALENPLFGDWVAEKFLTLGAQTENRELVNNILQDRARESERAGVLWLRLNRGIEPAASLIESAYRSLANQKDPVGSGALASDCQKRLEPERWRRFARWMLPTGDRSAAGAALALHDAGERRLSVLGDSLMAALHDGGYVAKAEKVLAEVVNEEGESGVRWLASRMAQKTGLSGGYSGWWRVFLKEIDRLDDGPELLAKCVHNIDWMTLPRYPELREAFRRLLCGKDAEKFRSALRNQLHNFDPEIRRGASLILVATDPQAEAEALFVAIRSRNNRDDSNAYEWETFCLSLEFSPSVLLSLKSKLKVLDAGSRILALVLLLKGGVGIDPMYRSELESELFGVFNWHLARDPVGQNVLGATDSMTQQIAQLERPNSELTERVADYLLTYHRSRLPSKTEAKCIAIKTKPGLLSEDLHNLMARIARDYEFAKMLKEVCKEIRSQGAPMCFSELVLRANADASAWKDVVWAMLCDDTRLGGSDKADANGETLLRYSFEISDDARAIGEAAKECLNDPRMKNSRWADAYHWLAVLADEFVGLDADSIRNALRHGRPIWCSAAASLVARLGEIPVGVAFERGVHRRPASFSGTIQRELDVDRLLVKLREYSRNSDDLHPAVIGSIQECLFLPALTEQSLSELASIGNRGVLISNALRFCYGSRPKLEETLPLLDVWEKIWRQAENGQDLLRLLRLWNIVREAIIRDGGELAKEYLVSLETSLSDGEIWSLPLASEILRIRGSLTKPEVRPVLLAYAAHPTFLHGMLFGQLCTWLAGESEEQVRDAVNDATHEALVILNEASWDPSNDWRSNGFAYLLFPCILWAFRGESSAEAEGVFLRGLRFAFEQLPRSAQHIPASDVTQIVSSLEPLLRKAPPKVVAGTIRVGLDTSEPMVRAVCSLIQSFAELSK